MSGPEAEVTDAGAYEATPFAARARRSAKGLGIALALLGFALSGLGLWYGAAPALAAAAYQFVAGHGVFRRRLWGVTLAALEVAGVIVGVPLALTGYAGVEPASALAWGGPALVLAIVALPAVLTLLKDAERQYAVGRWV